jgi:hypothetical protein
MGYAQKSFMNFLWPLVPAMIGTAFLALVFRQRKAVERAPEAPDENPNDAQSKAIAQLHEVIEGPTKTGEKLAQIKLIVQKVEKEEREHAHP